MRSLAKELKVSALTVKKAYDALTEEGFIITIHGKGSFVAFANQNVMLEEKRKEAVSYTHLLLGWRLLSIRLHWR